MFHGRLSFVCALLLVVAWGPAMAAQRDRKPPKITHTPVTQAVEGRALEIRAQIADPSGVFEPTLFYRSAGSREYLRATLVQTSGDYVATIPAAAVVGEIEYFVEAFDEQGNGPARAGSPAKPLVVKVMSAAVAPTPPGPKNGTGTPPPPDPGTTTPPPDTTTSTEPAPGDGTTTVATSTPATEPAAAAGDDGEGGNGILIAAIAGGAGALALGAVGAGVLVWALFFNTPEPPGSVTVVVAAPPPVRSLQGVP